MVKISKSFYLPMIYKVCLLILGYIISGMDDQEFFGGYNAS